METSPPEGGTFTILFVCTGNTCRSPMAEAIARRQAAELGWDRVEFRSAGIGASRGSPASAEAVQVAAEHGLDLSEHESRLLTEQEAEEVDLILTMSPSHLMRVLELGGGDRATLLTSFAGGADGRALAGTVPDPIGGSDEEYEETFRLLSSLIGRVMDRLQPTLPL